MSIATKRGDEGMTDLMYGRRISKCDPRVASYGAVDELNAALGLVRVSKGLPSVLEQVSKIQKQLIPLMGELATAKEDAARYAKDYGLTCAAMTAGLSDAVTAIETDLEIRFKGWAIPGDDATPCSAYLDLARTICRRAERHVAELLEADADLNREPLRFLNRLSDLLWLLARKENLETLGK
jgi:cob(I)alamin adenosyltransferase